MEARDRGSATPGAPNWISTAGHRKGVIFFRWFLAQETPATPIANVERADLLRFVAAAGRGVAIEHDRRQGRSNIGELTVTELVDEMRPHPATCVGAASCRRRKPFSVNTGLSEPRRSDGHGWRSTKPSRTSPSIRRVMPLGDSFRCAARSVIRTECPGASERRASTS